MLKSYQVSHQSFEALGRSKSSQPFREDSVLGYMVLSICWIRKKARRQCEQAFYTKSPFFVFLVSGNPVWTFPGAGTSKEVFTMWVIYLNHTPLLWYPSHMVLDTTIHTIPGSQWSINLIQYVPPKIIHAVAISVISTFVCVDIVLFIGGREMILSVNREHIADHWDDG